METREPRALTQQRLTFSTDPKHPDLLHIGLTAEEANFGLHDVHTLDDAGT
jgi:hypothetical protein